VVDEWKIPTVFVSHSQADVRRLVSLAGAAFVAIDIGLAYQEIWAELTPQAAEELRLESGCEVTCLLKAHSLRIVSGPRHECRGQTLRNPLHVDCRRKQGRTGQRQTPDSCTRAGRRVAGPLAFSRNSVIKDVSRRAGIALGCEAGGRIATTAGDLPTDHPTWTR
jgi:molybdopterin-binding protein